MFRLTKEEAANLRFQNGTRSWGGRRTLPYAFTKHGVVMLSAVLRCARAARMSIAVVQVFVRLREMLAANKDLAARVEKLEHGQGQISSIIEVLVNEIEHMKALPSPNKRKTGFDL
jgi:ORF6N domain-containing protein